MVSLSLMSTSPSLSNVINVKLDPEAAVLEMVVVTGQGSGIAKRKLSTIILHKRKKRKIRSNTSTWQLNEISNLIILMSKLNSSILNSFGSKLCLHHKKSLQSKF